MSPDEITDLIQYAIDNIASEDVTDIGKGGKALYDLRTVFEDVKIFEPKIGRALFTQTIEYIEQEIIDLKNPWFANERMKIAFREGKPTSIILT